MVPRKSRKNPCPPCPCRKCRNPGLPPGRGSASLAGHESCADRTAIRSSDAYRCAGSSNPQPDPTRSGANDRHVWCIGSVEFLRRSVRHPERPSNCPAAANLLSHHRGTHQRGSNRPESGRQRTTRFYRSPPEKRHQSQQRPEDHLRRFPMLWGTTAVTRASPRSHRRQ